MKVYPKGGLIGKSVHLIRAVRELRISLYAANACYFLVLSVFPGLLLLLSLLRYTPVEVEQLAAFFAGVLPESFLEGAEELILLTYDNTGGATVGISAAAALWSASRGIYGVRLGLNGIYGTEENRGYFYTRFLSALYLLFFLAVLLLTLGLQVFGSQLRAFLDRTVHSGSFASGKVMGFRLPVLLTVQSGFFAAMFMALPSRKNGFWESLPGAVLASAGWLVFSRAYSVYVEYFADRSNVYGSVYAIALSMLWLYCCMSIVFYGGALNVVLRDRRRKS